MAAEREPLGAGVGTLISDTDADDEDLLLQRGIVESLTVLSQCTVSPWEQKEREDDMQLAQEQQQESKTTTNNNPPYDIATVQRELLTFLQKHIKVANGEDARKNTAGGLVISGRRCFAEGFSNAAAAATSGQPDSTLEMPEVMQLAVAHARETRKALMMEHAHIAKLSEMLARAGEDVAIHERRLADSRETDTRERKRFNVLSDLVAYKKGRPAPERAVADKFDAQLQNAMKLVRLTGVDVRCQQALVDKLHSAVRQATVDLVTARMDRTMWSQRYEGLKHLIEQAEFHLRRLDPFPLSSEAPPDEEEEKQERVLSPEQEQERSDVFQLKLQDQTDRGYQCYAKCSACSQLGRLLTLPCFLGLSHCSAVCESRTLSIWEQGDSGLNRTVLARLARSGRRGDLGAHPKVVRVPPAPSSWDTSHEISIEIGPGLGYTMDEAVPSNPTRTLEVVLGVGCWRCTEQVGRAITRQLQRWSPLLSDGETAEVRVIGYRAGCCPHAAICEPWCSHMDTRVQFTRSSTAVSQPMQCILIPVCIRSRPAHRAEYTTEVTCLTPFSACAVTQRVDHCLVSPWMHRGGMGADGGALRPSGEHAVHTDVTIDNFCICPQCSGRVVRAVYATLGVEWRTARREGHAQFPWRASLRVCQCCGLAASCMRGCDKCGAANFCSLGCMEKSKPMHGGTRCGPETPATAILLLSALLKGKVYAVQLRKTSATSEATVLAGAKKYVKRMTKKAKRAPLLARRQCYLFRVCGFIQALPKAVSCLLCDGHAPWRVWVAPPTP